MFNINLLDIIFIALAAFVIIHATVRGFLDQVFSTASLVGSFIVAILFYKPAASFLRQFINFDVFQSIIAFLILFLLTYTLIKVIQIFVSHILDNATISSFDHALGFFLGVLKAAVIIFILIFILGKLNIAPLTNFLKGSVVARFVISFTKNFI